MPYDNTNRGQLWGNDKKESEKHPDFKGSVNVEGVEYWLSAWKRAPGANPKAPALSFSLQRKDEERPQGGGNNNADPFKDSPSFGDVPDDSEIPF